MLPATAKARKQCFDLLDQTSSLRTDLNSGAADVHKGKVGTVLDVGINQLAASRLTVCVHLEQSYSAVHAYHDIWLDYDEVVEEMYVS